MVTILFMTVVNIVVPVSWAIFGCLVYEEIMVDVTIYSLLFVMTNSSRLKRR